MGMDYFYYLTVKRKDKLYPFGPFDYRGEFKSILTTRNEGMYGFNSNFWTMGEEMFSDELTKALEYESINDFIKYKNSFYLPLTDLPTGSYVRKRYCLIDDIKRYEEDDYLFDGFYDTMTPDEYARCMENELKFGPPKEREDDCGTKYTPHSVSEYSFYMYEDLESDEYYASRIRSAYNMLKSYSDSDKEEDIYVALFIW